MGVSVGPGATIAGRYRIESPIGEGGFGAVFRATDLQRSAPVAVKVLASGAVESGARFRREAELAMRLSHPNTVRTFDAGEDAEAGPFMVLELLLGGSLEQVLRSRGGCGPRRAAEIGLAVLGSLREAHAIGIIHRDIKPANVFLLEAPSTGVKVLDFGIAKSTNEGTRAGLTREGQTIGTPAYMAPEQVKGGELGPETDLYALGLVLAEAVSGKPVYATDNGLAVLVDKLNGGEPTLPAVLVGTPLEPVVRKATRPNREDRYRTAEEMIGALQLALAEMPHSSLRGSMRVTGPVGAGEWGTESVPFPSASPTEVASADTYGMDVPSPRPSSSGPSAGYGSGRIAAISSAPTASASLPSDTRVSAPAASGPAVSAPDVSAPAVSAPATSDARMSLPATSAPATSDARMSLPATSAPVRMSSPAPSAPIPSGPAFSLDQQATPYASPFARPAPTLPPEAPKASGLKLGCLILALVLFIGVAGVGGLAILWMVRSAETENPKPRTPRTAPTPLKPGTPPPTPVPAPAPLVIRPAIAFTCAGLGRLDATQINPRVNAAPGFQVQDQTTIDMSSVEITMRQNGADAGRLIFIDGATPSALQTAEAGREPDEPDAIYATKSGKFLYVTLSAVRAKDLIASLCGAGSGIP